MKWTPHQWNGRESAREREGHFGFSTMMRTGKANMSGSNHELDATLPRIAYILLPLSARRPPLKSVKGCAVLMLDSEDFFIIIHARAS